MLQLAFPSHMSKTALARLARDQNCDTPLHDWQQQQSKQLSLFVGGERQPEQFSNTLEKYDALPKYVMNRRAWCKNEGDIVHHVRRDFKLDGRMHSIELLPAIIRDAKGNQREAFAGTREEMVEQALRKIALRNSLVSLSGNGMSGVAFAKQHRVIEENFAPLIQDLRRLRSLAEDHANTVGGWHKLSVPQLRDLVHKIDNWENRLERFLGLQ